MQAVNKKRTFNKNIKFIQVNLHHAKGASAVLCKRFTESKLDVAFIQEPWAINSRILGITTNFKFIKRDIAAVMMEVPTAHGTTVIYVASAYFPGDVGDVPPPEVAAFVSYCKKQNKSFIIGCDANAHHTVWASTDINNRGEYLLDYISKNEIDICNRGDAPTFMNAVRQEVLDLTLCSPFISDNINNWHVSSEESLSDHKHIIFEYEAGKQLTQYIKDPRKTDWELYNSKLDAEKIYLYLT
ncbi:uncharacterized protein LOC134206995 [Armigeres subalbatus]|uniref:uncharacterized protein LOC134206995 n=1 Tax=Armigeres subalbatus TaxID=124917 RepID=UPI002ED367F4